MSSNTPRNQAVILNKKIRFEAIHINDIYEKDATMHHHDYLEIYYFIDGNVSYQVEGNRYDISPNTIMVVNNGDLHKPIINDKDKVYERYVLKITEVKLGELARKSLDLLQIFDISTHPNHINIFTITEDNIQIIKPIFDCLCNFVSSDEFGCKDLADCYIKQLFIFLIRCYSFAAQNAGIIYPENPIAMNDILNYIANNLDTELCGEQISKEFYISKFYLSREFKKYVGTTMHRYITQKKLILAKELILKGIPINEIYCKCGFADYCNFFRAFKSEYGITPKNFYRQAIKD